MGVHNDQRHIRRQRMVPVQSYESFVAGYQNSRLQAHILESGKDNHHKRKLLSWTSDHGIMRHLAKIRQPFPRMEHLVQFYTFCAVTDGMLAK